MGLQDILAFSTVFSEARVGGGGTDDRPSKKAKLDSEHDPKSRQITGFFTAAPAVSAAAAAVGAAADELETDIEATE